MGAFSSADRVDKARYLVALVAVLAILAAVMVMSTSDRTAKPMAINGDQLGQDTGESFADYAVRAENSLAQASGDPSFALVTFTTPVNERVAGRILEQAEIARVNAAFTDAFLAIALPEPTSGHNRADVIAQQLKNTASAGLVRAVAVYDDATALTRLAAESGVAAVEVAPHDAAWGRMGIRPVIVDAPSADSSPQ